MSDLLSKQCQACEGGVSPLTKIEAENLLKKIPAWQLDPDTKKISRSLKFKNFYETMSFVNALAWLANQEGHHPDLEIGYNYCHIHWTTHALQGLSENDFICAAKTDRLLGK